MDKNELISRIINRTFSEEPRHMINSVDAEFIIKLVKAQLRDKVIGVIDELPYPYDTDELEKQIKKVFDNESRGE